ncbi:hypothetical protein WJX77_003913 [Trebouxia sp. C0004]
MLEGGAAGKTSRTNTQVELRRSCLTAPEHRVDNAHPHLPVPIMGFAMTISGGCKHICWDIQGLSTKSSHLQIDGEITGRKAGTVSSYCTVYSKVAKSTSDNSTWEY